MAEISIRVPIGLKNSVEKLDQPTLSKTFQRAMLEVLIAKSKLTKSDASLLAKRLESGMVKEVKQISSKMQGIKP